MKKLCAFFIVLVALLIAPVMAPAQLTTLNQVDGTATTTSTEILSANMNRNYLLIQNNGSVTIYVKFGSAHSGSEGVLITAGGNYEPIQAPSQSVYIKSASSTAAITVIEGY